MIWIYRGSGWAVLAIQLAILAVVVFGVKKLVPGGSAPDFFRVHAWPIALALVLAGVINLIWGITTNYSPRVVVDPETGIARTARVRHSLYFIPVEYWGAASLVGAAACLWLMPF